MDRVRTDAGHRRRAPARGGALVAVVSLLLVVALSVFALAVLRSGERSLATFAGQQARLDKADGALAQFVTRHRRLPCPARGSIASGAAGAGTESINLATGQCVPADQADGVLPWVSLGLAENDALDGWNGRLSYRVQPSLASNLMALMNMSWCRPNGPLMPPRPTGAAQACFPAPCPAMACMHANYFLYAKGLQVQDGSGGWLNRPAPPWAGSPAPPPLASGAAYVLVAHGRNGAGAYNASGNLQAGSPAPGNGELPNRNGQALTGATVFLAQPQVGTPDATYFDDVLSHPTLSVVLGRAALGPRLH